MKMNAETLKALKASIAKWRGNETGKHVKIKASDCPLCSLFFDKGCDGCPVSKKTGRIVCYGSPYIAAANTAYYGGMRTSERFRREAKLERQFLESLLPKKRKKK